MQLLAFSIYDNKALQFHTPFFSSTDGAAVRSLSELVSDANTTIGRHPSDYVLYCIGSYDDNLGAMVPISPLRHVIDAVALVKIQPPLPLGLNGGKVPYTYEQKEQ